MDVDISGGNLDIVFPKFSGTARKQQILLLFTSLGCAAYLLAGLLRLVKICHGQQTAGMIAMVIFIMPFALLALIGKPKTRFTSDRRMRNGYQLGKRTIWLNTAAVERIHSVLLDESIPDSPAINCVDARGETIQWIEGFRDLHSANHVRDLMLSILSPADVSIAITLEKIDSEPRSEVGILGFTFLIFTVLAAPPLFVFGLGSIVGPIFSFFLLLLGLWLLIPCRKRVTIDAANNTEKFWQRRKLVIRDFFSTTYTAAGADTLCQRSAPYWLMISTMMLALLSWSYWLVYVFTDHTTEQAKALEAERWRERSAEEQAAIERGIEAFKRSQSLQETNDSNPE